MNAPGSVVERIRWRDGRLMHGWLVAALAGLLYLAFFPKLLVNSDEYYYAGEALTLARGRLIPVDGDGLPYPVDSIEHSLRYPPSWPLMLAAGRVVSIRGMWCVALLIHLAGGMAFARLMVRRGLPAWATAAWLFHPVAWLYARTIMSDAPSAAMLIIAIDAWENRDRACAPIALALVSSMRVASLLTVAGFGLAILPELRSRQKAATVCAGAVALAIISQMAVNRIVTGHWIGSGYESSYTTLIGYGMALENAALYLAGLTFLPPFVLAFALTSPRGVERWALVAIPTFAFLVGYQYHDVGRTLAQTFVGGQRLMLPAYASLLLATSGTWTRWWPFSSARLLLVLGSLVVVAVSIGMQELDARFVSVWRAVRACRPSVLGYTVNAGRVALSVDADRYVAMGGGRVQDEPVDVVLIGTQYESNRPGATQRDAIVTVPARGTCYEVGSYRIVDFTGRCPVAGRPCERAESGL